MKLPSLFALAFLAFSMPDSALARSPSSAHHQTSIACGTDSYVNVIGHCVHRPMQSTSVPVGATARCRDGSYSFSEHHRGTCSYHGGVAQWLN
jgi:hypothetical protein